MSICGSHQILEHLHDVLLHSPDADEAHVVATACGVRGRLGIHEFQIRWQPGGQKDFGETDSSRSSEHVMNLGGNAQGIRAWMGWCA